MDMRYMDQLGWLAKPGSTDCRGKDSITYLKQ